MIRKIISDSSFRLSPMDNNSNNPKFIMLNDVKKATWIFPIINDVLCFWEYLHRLKIKNRNTNHNNNLFTVNAAKNPQTKPKKFKK